MGAAVAWCGRSLSAWPALQHTRRRPASPIWDWDHSFREVGIGSAKDPYSSPGSSLPIRSRAVAVSSSLSASGIRWNLGDLAADAEQGRREWDELLTRARDFAERRRGTVGSVGPEGLRELLDELDELAQDISRVHFYATAREHTEAMDPETNDL